MGLADRLAEQWYRPGLSGWTAALVPLAVLFAAASAARRLAYRGRWLAVEDVGVPVIVVGNITAGGAGKTPLVAALAAGLASLGHRPGIVSRGYGGATAGGVCTVPADGDPALHGDEPVLLARRGHPVVVGRDRVAAARALLARWPDCDVVIADDGLQHYRLARRFEIAVVDGVRGCGNGWLLPAGPLREPMLRLATVDAVVVNGADTGAATRFFPGALAMHLVAGEPRAVGQGCDDTSPPDWRGLKVHAVAGIGNPARFFATLAGLGIAHDPHPFPDHHRFDRADFAFGDDRPVLMTEKDAVKCTAFADHRMWYLPVEAGLDPTLVPRIEERLRGPQAA